MPPQNTSWWEHPAQLSEASKILQRNVFFFCCFSGVEGCCDGESESETTGLSWWWYLGNFCSSFVYFFPASSFIRFTGTGGSWVCCIHLLGALRRRRRRHEMVMMTFGATAAHTCWLGPKWGVWQERQIHTTVLSQRGLLTCRSWLMCPPLDEDQPYS